MTGMSISGKMSAGIRWMVTTPRMTMSIAITTKVYGRRSAIRTSHIVALGPAGEEHRGGVRSNRSGPDVHSGEAQDIRQGSTFARSGGGWPGIRQALAAQSPRHSVRLRIAPRGGPSRAPGLVA